MELIATSPALAPVFAFMVCSFVMHGARERLANSNLAESEAQVQMEGQGTSQPLLS